MIVVRVRGAHLTVSWGTALQDWRWRFRFPLWVTGIFHFTKSFGRTMALVSTHPLTEVNTNYILWRVKAAVVYGWQPWHLHVPIVYKSWETQPPGALGVCSGLYRVSFTSHITFMFAPLTPWAPLGNQVILRLYGKRRAFCVFTAANRWNPSWSIWIHSTTVCVTFSRIISAVRFHWSLYRYPGKALLMQWLGWTVEWSWLGSWHRQVQ